MSDPAPPPFVEDPPKPSPAGEGVVPAHEADALLLNLDGFDGPIDVLLQLARDQKVDLTRISILQLARQYLSFVDRARELRLELAAEYLVMAAWLAYLKSRLLLPKQEQEPDEPSGEQMAEALAFQLRRLEAMQTAASQLMGRPRLGVEIFSRGMPEGLSATEDAEYKVTLYDVLRAYGDIRQRQEGGRYELPTFSLMSMEEALDRMGRMLGHLPRTGAFSVWATLASFMPEGAGDRLFSRSALASIFTAGLELAKQGRVELRQDGLFRPIYVRASFADLGDDD